MWIMVVFLNSKLRNLRVKQIIDHVFSPMIMQPLGSFQQNPLLLHLQ